MNEAEAARLADPPRRSSAGRPSRSRVPLVLQTGAADCGVACLVMVARALGGRLSLREGRRLLAPGDRGVGAASLVAVGRQLGLDVRAYSAAGRGAIEQLPLPAILHWRERHFLVLEGWSRWRNAVFLVDPAEGRRTVRWSQLLAGSSGVALSFAARDPGAIRPRGSWWRSVLEWLRQPELSRLATRLALSAAGLQLAGMLVPLAAALWIGAGAPSGPAARLDVPLGAAAIVAAGWLGFAALRSRLVSRFGGRLGAAMADPAFPRTLSLPDEVLQLVAEDPPTDRILARVRQAVAARSSALVLDAAVVLFVPAALFVVAPAAFAVAGSAAIVQAAVQAMVYRRRLAMRVVRGPEGREPAIAALDLLLDLSGRGERGETLRSRATVAIAVGAALLATSLGSGAPPASALAAGILTAQLLWALAEVGACLGGLASIPFRIAALERSAGCRKRLSV